MLRSMGLGSGEARARAGPGSGPRRNRAPYRAGRLARCRVPLAAGEGSRPGVGTGWGRGRSASLARTRVRGHGGTLGGAGSAGCLLGTGAEDRARRRGLRRGRKSCPATPGNRFPGPERTSRAGGGVPRIGSTFATSFSGGGSVERTGTGLAGRRDARGGRRRGARAGWTLVEAMIALSLVVLGLVGFSQAVASSVVTADAHAQTSRAISTGTARSTRSTTRRTTSSCP